MKMYSIFGLSVISFVLILNSCKIGHVHNEKITSQKNPTTEIGTIHGDTLYVTDVIDLHNEKYVIPRSLILHFRGGVIKNGTLVGNHTQFITDSPCFDRVHFEGTWCMPIITTSFFLNLNYENSLLDVLALTNDSINNVVYIDRGDYVISVSQSFGNGLIVKSNTEIILKGIIRLSPNNYRGYNIINIHGDNIKIRGDGTIIGDRNTHLGYKGEWGMGINVDGSNNVVISDISIEDCWGDCLYVGNGTKNIVIEGCILKNGRRQGISITGANGLYIKKCLISNIHGALPEYAIDLEPNKGNVVDNVLIEDVEIRNCKGGILSSVGSNSEGKEIGKIIIKDCSIFSSEKEPIRLRKCKYAQVERCVIRDSDCIPVILITAVDSIVVRQNLVTIKNLSDNEESPRSPITDDIIKFVRTHRINIENNQLIEK